MAEELSIWASAPVTIHTAWFVSWLEGLSVRESVNSDRASSCEGFLDADIQNLLLREVTQQYTLFSSLTQFLNSPPLLQGQTTFHLPLGMCSFLCEKYYEFDDQFIRELMGKQLESGLRRTVESIALTTGLRDISCRRQFENLRRVGKALRPGLSQGTVVDRIVKLFLLSPELAGKYANVIFMCNNQISISRKCFGQLSFSDVNAMIGKVIVVWGQSWTTDFDPSFADEMRGLAADSQKLKPFVMQSLQTKGISATTSQKQIAGLLAPMATIVGNLHQPREARDLFLDVIDKLIEPLKKFDVRSEDVSKIFDAFHEGAAMLGSAAPKQTAAWQRCFKGFRCLVSGMYHL